MDTRKIKGLYLISTKTFYYIDPSKFPVQNSIQKIKDILVARELLYTIQNLTDPYPKYKVITLDEAQTANYQLQELFLSPHLKNLPSDLKPGVKVGWKKKIS